MPILFTGLFRRATLLAFVLAAPVAADDELVPPAVRLARDRVFPAVVRIDAHTRSYAGGEKELARGTGSGVIIDARGHVLTNYHVAGKAEKLIVTLVNKERVRARLVGADHWTDLAVIRLDVDEVKRKGAVLTAAPLGSSARVVIGETVLAMGTPFGLSRTMSQGVITNNERYFAGQTIDGYETGEFNNWLQTDAAINPGNSGGALVNLRGEVIGINTRAISLAEGLGFAVPIDVAASVVEQILATGHVNRSYVGLGFRELLDLETHFGLQANRGVLIESIDPRSPAAEAGLAAEDILLAVDGHDVSARFPEELPAVRKIIASRPAGGSVALRVRRGEDEREFKVTTVALESEVADDERDFPVWGVTARSITARYAARERLPDRAGALITGVKSASPADSAGVQVGDVVRAVNREPASSFEAFQEAYERATEPQAGTVLLEVLRGSSVRLLVLKPSGAAN